ncbi:MAG: hypothetical protein IJZ04_05930 [Clostridia bacterium]|nr:hypothetical protein [Clostridia bacterium]
MEKIFRQYKDEITDDFCNTEYDKGLELNPIYQTHPEMLPYIGKQYNKHRILCVGESHYLSKQTKNFSYDLKKWYTENLTEQKYDENNPLHKSFSSFFTRYVLFKHIVGKERGAGYSMFYRPAKACCDVIGCDEDKVWEHFAFMNYYQRPAEIRGESIDKQKEDSLLSKVNLDYVCKIIEPTIIVFLSKKAYNDWMKTELCSDTVETYEDCSYPVSHPTSHWWERKRKDGGCAKEDFRNIIKAIVDLAKRFQ